METLRRKMCAKSLLASVSASDATACLQIINLIKAQAAAKATADAEAANAQLQSELQSLTLKELRLRAAAEGVDEDAIEDARDGDSPKEDVRPPRP